MSNIHRYQSEVIDNARSILWDVKERQGKTSAKFWQDQATRFQGRWGAETVNIARLAMGRRTMFQSSISEEQMNMFVEKARTACVDFLWEIEKGK